MTRIGRLLATRTRNATIAWLFLASIAVAAGWNQLQGRPLWTGFTLACLLVVALPGLWARDPAVVPDWRAVATVAVPIGVRSGGYGAQWIVYLSLAGLALVVAVELDAFTVARFSRWFAVTFVVFATMSVASLWGIAQFLVDRYLGTAYLVNSQTFMWELVAAVLSGTGAGLVFDLAFRSRTDATAATG